MKDFDQMPYHPVSERLVQVLIHKTRNDNPLFFRVITGYYWCKLAASMRVTISTPDNGELPINMYALNLSPSGTGKGVSTGILESQITGQFRERFLNETFPKLADNNLPIINLRRAARMRDVDPDQLLEKTRAEFEFLGELLFDFSEATSPAVKQMRDKLLMANAGAVNLEIDEIGSNLLGQAEVLTTFLELFDQGRTKKKLTKNTSDSKRGEEIVGKTPTNLLMFGEPSKLLDGGPTEAHFYNMLQTGYARRCFFGYSRSSTKMKGLTAKEVYDLKTKQDTSQFVEDLSDHLERLADPVNHNRKLMVSEATSLKVIEYQLFCEERAEAMKDHEDIRKAEMSHRYWKALKLAGAYAFIDDSHELTEDHFWNAVKLAEASGDAFSALLSRDRPWVKLAKYLAAAGQDVTYADMAEDLPYFPTAETKRREILTMATAWGYRNNVILKKSVENGIDFYRGESLELTNLDQMRVAWSQDITTGYTNELAPWDQLGRLVQAQGLHWINHHVRDGYRDDDHCEPGFNILVLDVDGALQLDKAKELLEGHKALFYTTKRHTAQQNRFRILLPMKYVLKMDGKEFTEFYKNVEMGMPFKVDPSCSQRAKKWLSHAGHFEFTDGELFDPVPFIPRTSKAEEMKEKILKQGNIDNLQRWILNHIADGNRNNMLLRYAMILLDAGMNAPEIHAKVRDLNDKTANKLSEAEIQTSIMVTVAKKLAARGQVPGNTGMQGGSQGAGGALPQLSALGSQYGNP